MGEGQHKPPLKWTMMFCPGCGRNDRFHAFKSKHLAWGRLCKGVPVLLVYVLDKVRKPAG